MTGKCWDLKDLAMSETAKHVRNGQLKRDVRRLATGLFPSSSPSSEEMMSSSLSEDPDDSDSGGGASASSSSPSPSVLIAGDTQFTVSELAGVRHAVASEASHVLSVATAAGVASVESAVALQVSSNLSGSANETKALALALVTATLAEEANVGKAARLLAENLRDEQVTAAASGGVANGVLKQEWIPKATFDLFKWNVDWWLNDALYGSKYLQKEVVKVGVWLVPHKWTVDIGAQTLVWLMDPETGYLKAPFVQIVSSSLPTLQPVVEAALKDNAIWCLKDQWYKDYAKNTVLQMLNDRIDKSRGREERTEDQQRFPSSEKGS